jgi:hypothetical protein
VFLSTACSLKPVFVCIFFVFVYSVIAFAGDALICVFADTPRVIVSSTEETPSFHDLRSDSISSRSTTQKRVKENCCLRALQCALVLRTHQTKALSAHIGVSFGSMRMALLGGLHNQWIYVLNGQPVSDLAACINATKSQEVAATESCYQQANLSLKSLAAKGRIGANHKIVSRPVDNSNVVLIESIITSNPNDEAHDAFAIFTPSTKLRKMNTSDSDNSRHISLDEAPAYRKDRVIRTNSRLDPGGASQEEQLEQVGGSVPPFQ